MSASTISIGFKVEDGGQGFDKLNLKAKDFHKLLETTVASVNNLDKGMFRLANISQSIDSAKSSLQELQGILSDLSGANAAQVEAETKLAQNMRNTMNAREADIQSIKDLCSAQQQIGVIGDEVQLAGAQELATYLSEKDALASLIPVMNDMLAQQYGLNASQENAAQIATMLGKVMDGQTGALKRYGYSFDEAQEAILKNGDEMQRVAVLAEVVQGSVGGMNEALAATPEGKLKQTENHLGDIKEKLGSIATLVAPITNVTLFIMTLGVTVIKAKAMVAAFSKEVLLLTPRLLFGNKAVANAIPMFKLYAAGVHRAAIGSIALKVALRGLLVASGIGAVIWALSEAMDYFSNRAEDAEDSLKKLLDTIETAKSADEASDAIGAAGEKAAKNAKSAIDVYLRMCKEFKGSKAEEAKLVKELNDAYGDEMGYFSTVQGWYKALTKNSADYCRQMERQARIQELIARNETLTAEISDIRGPEGNRKKYSDVHYGETKTFRKADGSYEKRVVSLPSELDKANAAIQARATERSRNNAEIAKLKGESTTYAVQGSSVRPDSTAGQNAAAEAKKTELQKINEAITKAENRYVKASETERKAIRATIADLRDKKEAIEAAIAEASLPTELDTIEAVDAAISYQQNLRKKATAENIAAIDQEIERLQDLRDGIDQSGFVEINPADIGTYDELEKQLAHYSAQLKKAAPEERESIQARIVALQDLRKEWDALLAAMDAPADISALDTLEDLDEAISYYTTAMQKATAKDIAGINATIKALERKRTAMTRIVDIADRQREADKINALSGREYRVKVSGMGFDALTDEIRELDRMLSDLENPLSDADRAAVERLRDTYAGWRKEAALGFDTYREGWGAVKGVGSGIESLTDALEGDANAWDTLTGIVDGFLQIYDGIAKIVEIVDMITAATKGVTAAKKQETAQTVTATAATAAEAETSMDATVAKGGEAIAGAVKSGSSLPFPANLAAIAAGLAAVMAVLAMTGCFATGGIVGGTSRTGDRMLARVNSGEMILNPRQQKRLFDLLDGSEALGGVTRVREVPVPDVEGTDIVGVAAEINITGRLTGRGSALAAVLANSTRLDAISGRRSNIQS